MSTSGGRENHRNRRFDSLTTLLGGVLFAAVGLLSGADGEARALTPKPADKAEIVFVNGGRIVSVKADGSDREVLTRRQAWVGQPWGMSDSGPMVSPDGESILFDRYYDGFKDGVATGPMVIGADGTGLRQLIAPSKDHDFYSGAWAADGERIYLLEYVDQESDEGDVTNTTTLFTVKPDGSDRQTVLTSTVGYREGDEKVTGQKWIPVDVRPAPDGKHLLIESFNVVADKPARLEWVDPQTGARSIFEADASSAAWSPDGSQVAFTTDRGRINVSCYEGRCSGNPQIFIKQVDSGAVRRLLPGRPVGSAWEPAWSSDGSRIAFSSDRRPGASDVGDEIWTVAPDGSCLNRVTSGAPDSSEPNWMPGGSVTPCFELAPRPLGEVTVAQRALEQKPRPLWVGPSFKGSLMDDTFLEGRELGTAYDDCGEVEGNCPPPISIGSGPVCSMGLSADLVVGQYFGLERLRGGLLIRNVRRDGVVMSHFYAGGMETRIISPGVHRKRKVEFGYHRKVVRALRPVTADRPVAGSLGDPVLPWRTVRKARAMVKAYGKVHNLKVAADRAGVFREKSFIGVNYTKAGASAWLRFGRDLKRLGKVKSVKCRHWSNRPETIDVRANLRETLP